MTSFDYNYQNAFHCNLCYANLVIHEWFFTKEKDTEYNGLPQSILVAVVKWCHHANVLLQCVACCKPYSTLFCTIQCPTDSLTGWLTHWLSDWFIDCLIDTLTIWLIHWLSDWFIDHLIDTLTVWLTHWLSDWLIDCLSDWLIDSLTSDEGRTLETSVKITLHGV